jgi:hypothetical protein
MFRSDRSVGTTQRLPRSALDRSAGRFLAVAMACCCGSGFALGKYHGDDDAGSAKTALPNIYLDLRTTYATLPANTLSIGLGDTSLLATLSNLATLVNPATLSTAPTLSSPASQNIGLDVPLTVDVNDRVSLYGGFTSAHLTTTYPAGRHLRSAAGLSDFRPMSISRTAGRSRP